ncbi:hypothetical protein HanIR_Chr15g0750941 [Helianthus annuus]|nr:hypothetical protein HanIR_Chr15g0750941 [Helianthus annuus]
MNPLTGSEFIPLLPGFPRSLNLLNFRVSELGQEYALQYISYRPNANSIGDSVTLYMEKVAFCNVGVDGFVLLTIHVSGKLALLRKGERVWNIINDLPEPYDDVLYHNGEFFAVDSTGRTVVVDWEKSVLNVVAGSVFGGDNCGFSASAEEFPGCKGNCVFFTGQNREDDGLVKSRGVGVFDLESGSIGAISNDAGYSQLFWPPPQWLHSDPLNLEEGLDHLNI